MTTLLSIRARQGIPAPQTPDEWDAYEKMKAERREKNVANAVDILGKHGIIYAERRRWPEREWVVNAGGILVFYYPERGIWYDYSGVRHFGCRNLAKFCLGE